MNEFTCSVHMTPGLNRPSVVQHDYSSSINVNVIIMSSFSTPAVDDMYSPGGYLQVSHDAISLMSCILIEKFVKSFVYNVFIGIRTTVECEVKSSVTQNHRRVLYLFNECELSS